jgi:ankyrin repeat protein
MDLEELLDDILNTKDYDAFDELMRNEPNRNELLHTLAYTADPRFLKILFRYSINPNFLNEFHETAIMSALDSEHGDPLETVKVLLQHGTNPNIEDSEGNNALHKAVLGDDPEMVKLLLDYDTDRYKKNHSNESPLDIAEEDGNDEIKNILLNYQDYPNIKIPDDDYF